MNKELYKVFVQGLTEDETKKFILFSPREQELIFRTWNSIMLENLFRDMRKIAGIA
ncbi:hypothetical protein PP914_gp190 [Arthrobacter phage Qui]|uniref:Uncharacterized protein n=1 Tax=Arthrobacter phage Qui TaxID=2603260 RepID=A0A5B8WPR2_9CAUD|nr:hypothetical protein PP914_gp190 [Arthrobacter phage Qui]QED11678.1 hypothetical protein SEA_QUI_190 [Arthrobacter phage Qui]QOC56509.1 hypothetical protein SEA_PAELLA_190 [Arthrobacter phage Paella]